MFINRKNSSFVVIASDRGLMPVAMENSRCDGVRPVMTGTGRRFDVVSANGDSAVAYPDDVEP